MKYIIKNCPVYKKENDCGYDCLLNSKNGFIEKCQNITDCLLKQIVEKCKEHKFVGYGAIEVENPLYSEIMQKLEIEEVDE